MANKILLIGEVLIDRYTKDNEVINKVGGAPLNVAIAVKNQNIEPILVSNIGIDEIGKNIIKVLKEKNISTANISKNTLKTTIANVKIDSNGERSFSFESNSDLDITIDQQEINFSEIKVIHLGAATIWKYPKCNTYNSYKNLAKIAKEKNITLVFDPNFRDALVDDITWKKNVLEFIKIVDLVKLSEEEAKIITNESNWLRQLKTLNKITNANIIITRGSKGCAVLFETGTAKHNTVKVNQVDTTGAGDAFIGTFIANYYCKNINLEKSLVLASEIGAKTTTFIGAFE